MTLRYPAGTGGTVLSRCPRRGGEEGGEHQPHPGTQPLVVRGCEGRGHRGSRACLQVNLCSQACCTVVKQSAAVTSPGRPRRVVEGATWGEWRLALGKRRGGGGCHQRRATLLPSPGEAASFLGDLVQEVPVKPRVNAAEDVGPPGRGNGSPPAPIGWPTTRR